MDILIFSADDHYYALSVEKVVRVIWVLQITPVPESPRMVSGVFDWHGKTIPVISFRQLLSLPEKNIELEDILIILNVHEHQMALLSDHIVGVSELQAEDSTDVQELFTTQVVKYEERLVPLLDIDALIDHEMVHIAHKSEEETIVYVSA